MEVAPGVYQVPGVRGANIFLLASGDGLTLVDSGLPGDARAILRFIQALGHDTAELRRIILTHGHPDHTGSAKALRDATGAEVLIH
ncbi:MAG: MBL fold metallo-hydrolase, partial [Dehalococcoidia bacterium]